MQSSSPSNDPRAPFHEPGSKLMDIVNGVTKARALYVAAKFDVANCIPAEGRKSSDQIATDVGCDKLSIYRLLRALTQIGVFRECDDQDGYFEHNPVSLALRQENFRDYILYSGMTSSHRSMEMLPDAVKTGTSHLASVLDGLSYFDYLEKNPEDALVFGRAMTALTTKLVPALVAKHDFSGFNTVVDLGGSEGILLNAVLKANPSIVKGINFDLPNLIAKLKTMPERQANLDPRFQDLGGSFFDQVPEADLYILKHILHDWSDESVVNILKTVVKVMKPTSKIYVFDFLLGTEKNEQQSATVWLDLKMLNINGGSERALKDWQLIAKQTGLNIAQVVPNGMLPSLVVFTKQQ